MLCGRQGFESARRGQLLHGNDNESLLSLSATSLRSKPPLVPSCVDGASRAAKSDGAVRTLRAIERAESHDVLEQIRRGLVLELVHLIEAEGLCYALARQLWWGGRHRRVARRAADRRGLGVKKPAPEPAGSALVFPVDRFTPRALTAPAALRMPT